MRPLIAASVLLILTVNADPASACSCGSSGPPCQSFFRVDAVFVGVVRTITEVEAPPDPMPFRRRLVTFTVERALRGLEGASAGVTTGTGGGDCGYAFKAGERYLVYAYKAQDGQLHTGICSRTRPIAEAADDLRFIDGLRAAPAGARVSGTITHWARNLAGDAPRKYGPVADVHIQLRGPGGAREARTDEQGRYEITGIRPGKYELQVFPPAVFSSNLRSEIDLADARACAVADFGIHFDGRVSGVVRSMSGQPVAGVTLQLMASQHSDPRRPADMITATTDSAGYYELRDVPPGEYIVGVGLQRTMERDDVQVYPRTFYPGMANAAQAKVITIGEGTRVELDPLQLPAPLARRQLTGVVVWPDGRPAAGANISLSDGEASWRQVAVGINTDDEGRFTFDVYDGLSYLARAHYNFPDDPAHRQAQGMTGPFVVSTATAPLRVVLKPANR